MIPIRVLKRSDPYRLGRRAVAIALRHDLHAIVSIAQRYRSWIEPKRRRAELRSGVALVSSSILWFFLVTGGSQSLSLIIASVLLIGAVQWSVRAALFRERMKDVENILNLAVFIRETIDGRDRALYANDAF